MDIAIQKEGALTSTPHFAAALANFSIGRWRPAMVGMVCKAVRDGWCGELWRPSSSSCVRIRGCDWGFARSGNNMVLLKTLRWMSGKALIL